MMILWNQWFGDTIIETTTDRTFISQAYHTGWFILLHQKVTSNYNPPGMTTTLDDRNYHNASPIPSFPLWVTRDFSPQFLRTAESIDLHRNKNQQFERSLNQLCWVMLVSFYDAYVHNRSYSNEMIVIEAHEWAIRAHLRQDASLQQSC